jgi:hypothetical protein
MKKIILLLIITMLINSCDNQNRIDLESLTFKEKSVDLFKNLSAYDETREIATTLPVKYTKDVNDFKFGAIEFIKSDENDLTYNKVGLLFEKPNSSEISGITINIENMKQSIEILNYLKSKNGNPEIISPIPTENTSGQLLGYAAYLWKKTKSNQAIVLSQSYEYTNGKRDITSLIYIVTNNVKVSDASQELVIDRLIRTYKQ